MILQRPLLVGLSLASLSITAGCGKNQSQNFVKSVNLKTYHYENDAYAEVQAVLNSANMQMPSIDLPIVDPRHPGSIYGRVSLKPTVGGDAELGIAVNLTDVAQVPGNDPRLPNGAALPVGGLDSARVVPLPVANTGARVYLALDGGFDGGINAKTLMIGTAIPIREFNNIGRYVGGANIFLPFQFNNGVRGIAGIFTGQGDGQNGFALFVDVSALIPQQQFALARYSLRSVAAAEQPAKPLVFREIKPSAAKERRLNERLYYLNKRRTRLSVQ